MGPFSKGPISRYARFASQDGKVSSKFAAWLGPTMLAVDPGHPFPTTLILRKGSLRATLSLGSLRVAGFAVTLFSRRGVVRSQRAERILEDTRRRALKHPGTEPLDRLDQQSRNSDERRSAVTVFLHALLSTDVGLFDALIRKLTEEQSFANCAIVGWPHDTLTGIDANATELRSLIDQVIGIDGPPSYLSRTPGAGL